jgi:hypothetical protein
VKIQDTPDNQSTSSAGVAVMVPFGVASLPPLAADLSDFLSLLGGLVSISRVTWLRLDIPRRFHVAADILHLLVHH